MAARTAIKVLNRSSMSSFVRQSTPTIKYPEGDVNSHLIVIKKKGRYQFKSQS